MKIAVEGAPVPGSLTCPATSSWCREYNYDHFGNRWVSSNRTMHMAVPTSQSAFNAANNRLTAGGYDAAGNMTSHPYITPGGSMAYNANNLMTSFTATGVSVQTAYDAAGRRVRKIKGTEVTLWVYSASGRLAAEYRNGSGPGFAASTPEREYSYGVGRLVAVHEGTSRYYRTTDHLGSTRIVTDQTGAVKQRRDFFPFGEEIPADSSHGGRNAVLDGGVATYSASLGVRQQFTGQQRDSETGLDYFWARNLSAPLGRFLSVDPGNAGTCPNCPQTWNAYLYAKNSPHRYVDRDGKIPCARWEDPTGCEDAWNSGDWYLIQIVVIGAHYPEYPYEAQGQSGSASNVSTGARNINNARKGLQGLGPGSFGEPCIEGLGKIRGGNASNGVVAGDLVADLDKVRFVNGSTVNLTPLRDVGVDRDGSVADYFRTRPDGTRTLMFAPPGRNVIYYNDLFIGDDVATNQAHILHEQMHNVYGVTDIDISEHLGLITGEEAERWRSTGARPDGYNTDKISEWIKDNCIGSGFPR